MPNVRASMFQNDLQLGALLCRDHLNAERPIGRQFWAFLAPPLFACALLSCITLVNCFVISVPRHGSLPSSAALLSPSFAPLSHLARLKRHSPHRDSSSARNPWVESRLPLNVRNNGGETFKNFKIFSNNEQDYIRIEFQETDGSLVKQLVDFKNNLQIFRLVRLGEQDLNEQKWQTYCFITRLVKNEYISSDAMSKLTQKNPTTVREADIDHGSTMYDMDLEIPLDKKIDIMSPHLYNFCEPAQQRIYASEEDLSNWVVAENGNRSYQNLSSLVRKLSTVKRQPATNQLNQTLKQRNSTALPQPRRCGELLQSIYQNHTHRQGKLAENPTFYNHRNQEALHKFLETYQGQVCHCSLALVIPFYPCSVQHCTTIDPNNPDKLVSYRCGIKSCRKRYEFRFTVADKLFCLADFDSTIANSANNLQMVNESRENDNSGSQQISENASKQAK